MPYKSDAQRRFFHTDTAKKKGITDKEVNEFDQASKGMKLPEKKMAYGGETNAKHETVKSMENNPTAGFADGGEVSPTAPEMKDDEFTHGIRDGMFNGINGDWEAIKKAITDGANSIHQKYIAGMGDTGNLKGLQNIMDKKAGKEPQMADGGDASQALALQQLANQGSVMGQDQGVVGGTLQGLKNAFNPMNLVKPSAQMPQALAQGAATVATDPGSIDFTNQALGLNLPQAPTPDQGPNPALSPLNEFGTGPGGKPLTTTNPISQVHQASQSTPPTAPSIYQGITAEDRANLMQQLIAQKSSPGMLAAKGAAGLGDAITSAFGKAPTNALGNLRQNEQQNMEQRTGVVDTERQQKLQDLQASITQQENDPKTPYSNSMRDFYSQWTGRKVPSNVTAAQLKALSPEITKMFDTQTQSATARFKTAEEAQKAGADQGFFHGVGQAVMKHLGQPAEEFETALGKTAGIETPIQPAYAQNAQGHTIVSKDGGKSWQPIQ